MNLVDSDLIVELLKKFAHVDLQGISGSGCCNSRCCRPPFLDFLGLPGGILWLQRRLDEMIVISDTSHHTSQTGPFLLRFCLLNVSLT